jgi:hypothetical protein
LHAQEFISIAKIITIYHITKHALQFLALQRNWGLLRKTRQTHFCPQIAQITQKNPAALREND